MVPSVCPLVLVCVVGSVHHFSGVSPVLVFSVAGYRFFLVTVSLVSVSTTFWSVFFRLLLLQRSIYQLSPPDYFNLFFCLN